MAVLPARVGRFQWVKRLIYPLTLLLLSVGRGSLCTAQQDGTSALEAGFRSPPQSAQTSVWWHWINGNVSREGIVADLEDMKRVGVAGVQLIDVAMYSPAGPVRYHSDEWYGDVHFAMETAHRLGLVFGMANGPGWSGSGGPWVTPELAMKRLVWSETEVTGGEAPLKLPQPTSRLGFYKDIAVLAVPSDAPDADPFRVEPSPADFFERGTNSSTPFGSDGTGAVTMTYAQPVERRTLEIHCAHKGCSGSFNFVIEASDDGANFHVIRTSNLHGEQTDPVLLVSFPATTAKTFRIRVSSVIEKLPQLSALILSNKERVENYRSKTVDGTITPVLLRSAPLAQDALAIASDKVIDVTAAMSADGSLKWAAPPGAWTILRMGYTVTGATVHPPQPEGEGLEIDKMNAAATDLHFDRSLGRVIREAGPLAGTTFKQVLIDSWESGQQNWTADFAQAFAHLRGYAITPYLAVLTGRVVTSHAASEAFLRDFRRTISELVAANYYGEFRRLGRQYGLELYAEAYPGTMFNEITSAAQVDAPMTEFWAPGFLGYNGSVKLVASAAHTTGKRIVAGESFTGAAASAGWLWTPATLKPIGDSAFASGLNQTFLHTYVHQPRSDVRPGWTMGRYGTQFGRLEPWWQQGKPWLSYMARCQFLLQQGNAVSDVLALRTEDIDGLQNQPAPSPPPGVDFDWVAAQELLGASVTSEGISLVHGGTYHALWLPETWTADAGVLEQVEKIVQAGVPVFGTRPVALASLVGLRALVQWQALADRLWPAAQAHGASGVHSASAASRILGSRLKPDLVLTLQDKSAAPLWIHRHLPEGEVYFLANVGKSKAKMLASFREWNRRPELWDAVTGEHGNAKPFSVTAAGVEVPLELEPGGSIFVVFRNALPKRWLQSVTVEGGTNAAARAVPGTFRLSLTGVNRLQWSDGTSQVVPVDLPATLDASAGWSVHFEPPTGAAFERHFDKLHDLALDTDPKVHYFTGTATYAKVLELNEYQIDGSGCTLELGDVQNIASVRVNGKDAAVLWTWPYTVDISALVKRGSNLLEIAVVDRWVNRMIGDEQLPPDVKYFMIGSEFNRGRLGELPAWYGNGAMTEERKRTTFASWQHFTKDSTLVPAGLLGPVRLSFFRSVPMVD